MSNSYPKPYILYGGKKVFIKKIKISKLKLDFKNTNILISSNKLFLKLKDKKIQIINS